MKKKKKNEKQKVYPCVLKVELGFRGCNIVNHPPRPRFRLIVEGLTDLLKEMTNQAGEYSLECREVNTQVPGRSC
jgi:hypothetical protein